ncbi:hypothetical protein [Alteromonas gilva]|uniref:Uncharacterized protein n=1 Tax=Alteromonas gilva TaxID=2987522 RepID=A0ABT5L0W4_9ALTE|nr:hypothetical protein [Alteromonas gilva]MDC8830665.1 hypothetical protein [Alteromonas gilva]
MQAGDAATSGLLTMTPVPAPIPMPATATAESTGVNTEIAEQFESQVLSSTLKITLE